MRCGGRRWPERNWRSFTVGQFGRKFEVAVKQGDSIVITRVKVRGDMIEIHLGAGNLGLN